MIGVRVMPYYVYILASRPRGAIYVGSTNDLRKRISQHQAGGVSGHTKRYGITTLVWFERHEQLEPSLVRERQIKRWRRIWKEQIVEVINPKWQDISDQIPL